MIIGNRLLGNVNDDSLAYRVQALEKSGDAVRVSISASDAQRRRLRLTSSSGTEVGIALESGTALQDGDVLCQDDDESHLILVEVEASEAMAIRVNPRPADEASFVYGVKLGHMLGNQHWPIKVDGTVVLTPVNIDRLVMETVLRTHGFEGLEWEFISVEPGEVPTAMPRVDLEHEHG
ncbi:urease accessory protein UreE [Ferrimicrobium sp.]|uniref:urease accessory protein UreE n=1 Tax=Ferrimicrobium sp. TaxID=2926050 RepID=UPI002624EE99|nr:urease accessory protein UreE [Ferrimicrobium sp.]